jgi:outer membrane protein assembly factor BamB
MSTETDNLNWPTLLLLAILSPATLGPGCRQTESEPAGTARQEIAPVAQAEPPRVNLDPAKQWANWRGPLGTGASPDSVPPIEWSEEKNIRWKTALPGKGHSTPVIWGDRIFLTSAAAFGEAKEEEHEHSDGDHDNLNPEFQQRSVVLAINRDDGSILWEKIVDEERPHESTHVTGSWASCSPVTDGEYVIASFGSRGIYCLDIRGELAWKKDLGDMKVKHGHGEGSSPALHGDTVVINWDHEGDSFAVALDKHTGKEIWRAARDEVSSWSTPLIIEEAGRPQAVIAATTRVRSYDLATGKVIWECGGLSNNVVASPVAADGFLYAASSYEFQSMFAIRLEGASGDLTGTTAVTWKIDRHTPYVPSPLLYQGKLFFIRHLQAFLSCLEAKTGTPIFGPRRLPGFQMIYSSPVGAGGKVYVMSRNGVMLVIKSDGDYALVAANQLEDSFSASPAIIADELFLRGERHLYCVSEKKSR